MPASATALQDILDALTAQARVSFADVVADVDQHVAPTMALIAHNLVVIGSRLADRTYDEDIANAELTAQVNAAASVIVRFANQILRQIEIIINATLNAVRTVVNRALGVALL
jgi:hypothetical protein